MPSLTATRRGVRCAAATIPWHGSRVRMIVLFASAVVAVVSSGVSPVVSAATWSSSSSASGSRDDDVAMIVRQHSSSGFEPKGGSSSGSSAEERADARITFESLRIGDGSNATDSRNDTHANDTITFESLQNPGENAQISNFQSDASANSSTTPDIQRIPIEEPVPSVALKPNASPNASPSPAQSPVHVAALAVLSLSSSSSSSSGETPLVDESEAPTTSVIEIHGVPSPPTFVTAAAFDSSAVVTWQVPDDDGSDPILEYEVAWIDEVEGQVAGTKAVAHTPGSVVIVETKPTTTTSNTSSTKNQLNENELVPTTATIASLINGRSYSFKVRAKNVNGYSTWSAKSLAVSPLHPPDLCGRVTCSGHGTCFPSYEADRSTTRRLGTLVEGHCICRPGYNPPDCSVKNEASTFVWKVTEWGDCSNGCGGGQRTREATCWDALLDKQAADDALCPTKKPSLTRICNGMECGSKLVTVRYQVETSYDEVLFSPESWDAFELAFTTEVAAALQIPRTRLEISAVKRGSIVVFFQILPASRVGEQSLSDLWEQLQRELGNASSTLRSRGTFARRVETTGVKLSYSIADVSVAGAAGDISIPGLIGTVAVLCSFVALFGLFLRKRHERILQRTAFTLRKESVAGQNVLHAKRSELQRMGIRTMA